MADWFLSPFMQAIPSLPWQQDIAPLPSLASESCWQQVLPSLLSAIALQQGQSILAVDEALSVVLALLFVLLCAKHKNVEKRTAAKSAILV